MYQVIKMYGDCEPWWFLDGWELDVVSSREFEEYTDALRYYEKESERLAEKFPLQKSEREHMIAFFNPKEQMWCESCDEYLQIYHSLLLIKGKRDWLGKVGSVSKTIRSCQLK